MLVSSVGQSDSVIYLLYIHTYTLCKILSHCRLLQNIEYSSLCYTRGPGCWYIFYIIVWVCILIFLWWSFVLVLGPVWSLIIFIYIWLLRHSFIPAPTTNFYIHVLCHVTSESLPLLSFLHVLGAGFGPVVTLANVTRAEASVCCPAGPGTTVNRGCPQSCCLWQAWAPEWRHTCNPWLETDLSIWPEVT